MQRRRLIIAAAATAASALVPAPLAAQARVRTLWDDIAGVKRPWRHDTTRDPTGAALTRKVERFELRGGDCERADCAAGRARAERRVLTDLTVGDRGQCVYHLYFPSRDYTVLPKVETATGQLMLYDRPRADWGGGPIWALDSEPGSDKLFVTVSRPVLANGRLQTTEQKRFAIGRLGRTLAMDRWHQVVVDFTLAPGEGSLVTTLDGRRVMQYSGPTAMPGTQLGISYGILQSRTNLYPGGARAIPPQVVYYVSPTFIRT